MFDKTEVFKSEIAPILGDIKEICKKEKIPFFFTLAVSEQGEAKTKCRQDALTPPGLGIALYDDRIRDHVLICLGGYIALKTGIPHEKP
jgi:hypothetical protein